MSRQKYYHRRVTPDEFRSLLRSAGLSVRDFIFITGRRLDAIDEYLNQTALEDRRAYTPTMGDVMLLEIAARHQMADAMIAIANDYTEAKVERK